MTSTIKLINSWWKLKLVQLHLHGHKYLSIKTTNGLAITNSSQPLVMESGGFWGNQKQFKKKISQ